MALFTGVRSQTQIIYPELACKEALINAIAHRDYSIEGMGIEVNIFTDRLEIVSPGGLLSSVSIEDLRKLTGVHQSRNSLIAKVLRESGYMRELGEGMRRIFKLLKDNDLTPPILTSMHDRFSITLSQQLVYSEKERLWLENFSGFSLSRAEKTVVRLGYNNHIISPQEIWEACGIVDTEDYRQIIENLYQLRILKSVKEHYAIITEARSKRVPKKQIPRYQVIIPSAIKRAPIEKFDEPDYSKLFVGNISQATTKEELFEFFKPFGSVADVFIPIDFHLRQSKGFAFVEFEDRESAEKVFSLSNKLKIGDRFLYINWATPKVSK